MAKPATGTRQTNRLSTFSFASHPRTTLFAAWMVACAVILFFARERTFYYDEYDFILTRSLGDLASWLRPHNEHLVLAPLLVYRFIFEVLGVGTSAYWPYLIPVLASHGLVAFALFEILRREVSFWVALAAAVVMLFLGSGGENLLWAFQLGFVFSVAAGMSALALDNRHPRLAFTLLCLAVASSATGLVYVVAVAVWRLQHGRSAAALAVLPILYLSWFVAAGAHAGIVGAAAISPTTLIVLPLYVALGLIASLGGLTGLWPPMVPLFALALPRLVRTHTPLALAAVAGVATQYFVIGFGRVSGGDVAQGGSSRYTYIAATFWLLLLPWLMAQPWPAPVRRFALPVAFVLAITTNIWAFQANIGVWFAAGQDYPYWP